MEKKNKTLVDELIKIRHEIGLLNAKVNYLQVDVKNLKESIQSLESDHMLIGPLEYDPFTHTQEMKEKSVPRSMVEALLENHKINEPEEPKDA